MISITINDVANESPEALKRLGYYLLEAAGEFEETAPAASAPAIPEFLRKPAEPTEVPSPHAIVIDATAGAGAAPTSAAAVPVPPAPQTPAVPPTAPTAGIELDSAGLPWDSRIHAETRAKIGDGTWRYRRNCDKSIIEHVEAELRKTMAAAASVVAVDHGVHGGDHTATVVVENGVVTSVTTEPAAAVPPVPPVPPAAPAAPTPPTEDPAKTEDPGIAAFPALMEYVTPLMTAGKITTAQMMEMVKGLGLPHIGALASRTDLIPEMRKKIAELVGAAA